MKTLIKRSAPNGWSVPSLFPSSPFSLLEDVLNDNFLDGRNQANLPAVNISENPDQYLVELSAPGYSKEDFKVEMKDGYLTISGQKKEEKSEETRKFSRKEFSYGSFHRSFALTEDVNEENIAASYDSGILKITLPKREEAKPKAAKEIKVS